MRLLYDLLLVLYHASIKLAAWTGNEKARLWVNGRKDWQHHLRHALKDKPGKRIWFHCSSLGEFEQGRPLMEKLAGQDPTLVIVLTFYSPSGFEVRRNFSGAGIVAYLPPDSRKNARQFLDIVSPAMTVFVKYEFWYHYFQEHSKRRIPLYVVSAHFRKNQVFFRWYGGFFRRILECVSHFFVQDSESVRLLQSIGFKNASVSGDTRFDRVISVRDRHPSLPLLEEFSRGNRLLVAGSTWPEDEELLYQVMNQRSIVNLKLVLAPHEISSSRIQDILKNARRFFEEKDIALYSNGKTAGAKILVMDNMGLLSSAYAYGTIAWVGGGFGKGIHNILEAAVYGRPVIFGPAWKRFREARELIECGGAYSVSNKSEAESIVRKMFEEEQFLKKSSEASKSYVNSQAGSTERILQFFSKAPGPKI